MYSRFGSDRKELEEVFASRRPGARDDRWRLGKIHRNKGKLEAPFVINPPITSGSLR